MGVAFIRQKEIDNLLHLVPLSIGEAVIVTDLCANVLFMNRMAEKLTGYSQAEAYGKTIFEVFDIFSGESRKLFEFSKKINEVVTFGVEQNTSLITKNGEKLSIFGSISPVKNEADEILGLVIIAYNITIQNQLKEQLQYLSTHDALTGSYNRTWFEYECFRNETKFQTPFGLLMCDVDGLKMINDTMGHKIGDMALIATVKILTECIPEKGMIARVGGDEFVVLLPGSYVKAVRVVCKRIKQKISEYNEIDSEIPLSVSLGFAVSDSSSVNISGLFQEADNNMYKEKLHHKKSFRGTIINTILHVAEARDHITEVHSERLSNLVELMAFSLDLPADRINDLRLLAKFHDIGKVGIPDGILLKPEDLTHDEMENMQRHCEIGHHIAASSPDLSHIAHWILKHHEWWNGNGYPLGLKEENIPIECRILSIIDAYDAMTHDRPYRKAMSKQKALAELNKYAGIQFDPLLVFEFIRVFEALKIYVASSMKDVMFRIKQVYVGNNSQKSLFLKCGGSGTLMRRIEQGALVDIFISAGSSQMDELQMKNLIINDSRKDFLRNRIVLITSKNSSIKCGFEELAAEKIKKIGIGNPDTVPAGKYAQEVLMSFGISESVSAKLVFAKDVRQVLNYVETGYVDVGIVYQTEAIVSDNVKILSWAPETSHSPVVYSVAIMKASDNQAESENFIKFLTTNKRAKRIFETFGFIVNTR
ncbi:MAG: molybdate ABC transporter substrate-binding protein [Heliobacteriaceae bacterium]|nr:molybdate ABC transporter substrate-binding protein [Heliobacteriaceae bacterium]